MGDDDILGLGRAETDGEMNRASGWSEVAPAGSPDPDEQASNGASKTADAITGTPHANASTITIGSASYQIEGTTKHSARLMRSSVS